MHASISSSKSAVEGLSKSLTAEWATFARVNCIAPSLMDTPLAHSLLVSDAIVMKKRAAKRHPLGRVGNADHMAFWVSKDWGCALVS